MTTLHLIHGFVGAGKTTFAKNLECENNNIIRFTLDEWMIELFGQNPTKEQFVEFEPKIKTMIWKVAENLLKNEIDVILDYGFWKRQERDHYKNIAAKLGVNTKLYNLQCDDDVSRQRVKERTKEMGEGSLFIDENAINEFRQYFEPIEVNENSILVRTDQRTSVS